MRLFSAPILAIATLAVAASIHAQQVTVQLSAERDIPLKNWSAPPYWQPTQPAENHDAAIARDGSLNPLVSLPTLPLVFVAMTPCRVIDTRAGAGFPSPFGPPSLTALSAKSYPIQSSTTCSIPSTALAYSFNITVTPITTQGVNPPGYLGFLTIYPTGAALPNASTLNNYLGTVVSNAAIVPAGDNSGSISAYAHDATDMIVDINGYYAPGSGGSSQWTNGGFTVNGVPIFYNSGFVGVGTSTPSQRLDVAGIGRFTSGIIFGDGTTQTTAASGCSGCTSQWTTSGLNIFYNGGNVGIGTATAGQKLEVNGNLMVDGNINSTGVIQAVGTTVLQFGAGNGNGVAVGARALQSDTTGGDNTAVGNNALQFNTTGDQNVAVGYGALAFNTTGTVNIAVGDEALLNNPSVPRSVRRLPARHLL